jgi:hypothetical protein
LHERDQIGDLETLKVAILDMENYSSRDDNSIQNHVIYFHAPGKILDQTKLKLKSSINCVHTLRVKDHKTFANIGYWIKINRAMGVARLKLCAIDYENSFLTQIKNKYEHFIEVLNYEKNITKICMNLRVENVKECEKSYGKYFLLDKYPGLHEKMCSNECFTSSKYLYHYLTNYDIDEIIFPRLFSSDYFLNQKSNQKECFGSIKEYENVLESKNKYNLYDYAENLKSIYGKDVASFRFENFLVFNKYDEFSEELNNFDADKKLTNKFWNPFFGSSLAIKYYNLNHLTKLIFLIDSEKDLDYIASLKNAKIQIECLNRTLYSSNSILSTKWSRSIKGLMNNRYGKSLYNTNLTIAVSQHTYSIIKPGSREILVPIEHGFTSHFRDEDLSSVNGLIFKTDSLKYSANNLKIDLEYFYFLIKFLL